jgi:hypothetical protein
MDESMRMAIKLSQEQEKIDKMRMAGGDDEQIRMLLE